MKTRKLLKGQSLIELILVMGIFVTVVAGLAFFVFDSFFTSRLSYDLITADFLAEEGIEAARSIRDSNFSNLTAGNHGLTISGGHWIFQGSEENLSSQLNGGKRVILIENDPVDPNIKKITSKINWQLIGGRPEEVKIDTYLTNWRAYCSGTCTPCGSFRDRQSCQQQGGCRWQGNRCQGTCTSCDSFLNQNSCQAQTGCQWMP